MVDAVTQHPEKYDGARDAERRPWQGPIDLEDTPTFGERVEATAIIIGIISLSLAMVTGGAWIILACLGALIDALMAGGGA